ncbi:putative oxidoreductase [Gordonia otitidis NBRC 100426]|uniref:Oxidoreductase n=1 Tax=Gordonia otitidis (strain DSM 44809 / CCUG 52243 / JCM 12355 / NBRC 100426 / IFM 10032) TaxID=1108044 RepID=H5TQ92_GORO1|nr:putative oxidoreductase [Gordonia otitidis NBRC 100426]
MRNLLGGDDAVAHSRSPQIMADAAVAVLGQDSTNTGRCYLDVEALAEAGVTDLSVYGGQEPVEYDIFVDPR